MSEMILSLLLHLSLWGSIMILLIFFICLLLHKKVSSQWQYYIWIIVMIRLLLPVTPEINLPSGSDRQTHDSPQMSQSNSNQTNAFIASSISKDAAPAPATQSQNVETTPAKDTEKQNKSLSIISKNSILITIWEIRSYLCIVWLMAVLLLLLRKITIYQSFVRYARAGSTPIDNIHQLETLSTAQSQLDIHKTVDLRVNPLISSPMLIGFIHPCILLPDANLSEKEFYYTILHELTHYRRGDLYYKWLIQITLCIYWFNPLLYLVERNVNHLCELSCDEAVTNRLPSCQQRQEYANTLLNAMAAGGGYREHLASLTLSETKQLLKERLEAIMNKKKYSVTTKILLTELTAAIACASLITAIYTANASNSALKTAKSQAEQSSYKGDRTAPAQSNNSSYGKSSSSSRSKNEKITAAQADKMALALTHKTWVWDWVEFYVPYMSAKGAKKLISASQQSEWAGSVDMTTGKKLKFTQKQIDAARKKKPSRALTRSDIDGHALMIMQSNGDWNCISFMLPYMSRKGIRSVVNCYNSKHGDEKKRAADYY